MNVGNLKNFIETTLFLGNNQKNNEKRKTQSFQSCSLQLWMRARMRYWSQTFNTENQPEWFSWSNDFWRWEKWMNHSRTSDNNQRTKQQFKSFQNKAIRIYIVQSTE